MNSLVKSKSISLILYFFVGVAFYLGINLLFWNEYRNINGTTISIVSFLLFSMTLFIWTYDYRILFTLVLGMFFIGGLPLINLFTGYVVTPGIIINNLGIEMVIVASFLSLLYVLNVYKNNVTAVMRPIIVLLGGDNFLITTVLDILYSESRSITS